jgi:ribosomal protein L5
MIKFEKLQELLSLLNEAQDLIEEIYGDADEAFDMSINLSNVISDVEVEIDFEDIKLDQNLTINGVSVTIESRQ